MALTKEQILSSSDLKRVEVEVPEWGGSVFVTELTGTARAEFEAIMLDKDGKARPLMDYLPTMKVHLVARCIVDESGVRLFDNADVEALAAKNSSVLERVFLAAEKLNAIIGVENTQKN